MGSNEDIINSIKSYQERLERYVSSKNEDKMLYVVKKLNKLPITTAHLENTGVGRTVSALKKHEGKIGEAAKELVASWKDMVFREETASKENVTDEHAEGDAVSVYSSDHETDNFITGENDNSRNNHSNSYPGNDYCNDSNEDDVNSINNKYENQDVNKKKSEVKQGYSARIPEEQKKSAKKREHSADSDEVEKLKSKKYKRDHESRSTKTTDKYDDKLDKHESKKKVEDSENRTSSSKSKSRKREVVESGKSQHHSNKQDSHTSKPHSSSEKYNKHRERDERDDDKNSSSKKKEKKHRPHHHEKDNFSKKTSNYEDHYSDSKYIESKEKSKKHYDKSKETKSINKDKIINGIDSESGASFAEALGMCGPKTIPSIKKKSYSTSSDKHRNSSDLKAETSGGRSSSHKSSTSKSVPVDQETVPDLLVEKEVEPLNINIASLLPEISPNYKPLGVNFDSQPKRVITDDEALSKVMSNRNQRTKVYSGNKSFGKVESLFQSCVMVLQANIDALEYTGGVPYSILKPILEKATPDQLFNMEHHNPYLIEDTDELWLLHTQKEFRTKKRQELESWRDMYMRCLDEREARLSAITANIKQSQDKSLPIRTTKLAYVDSVVKPPRNIARQQAKNGIIVKNPVSTSTKLSALAKSGEAGKISVPNPGSRAGERSSNAASLKPKKAPLMAKTISFFKNRFKR